MKIFITFLLRYKLFKITAYHSKRIHKFLDMQHITICGGEIYIYNSQLWSPHTSQMTVVYLLGTDYQQYITRQMTNPMRQYMT